MRGVLNPLEETLLAQAAESLDVYTVHSPGEYAALRALWDRGLVEALPAADLGASWVRFTATPLGRAALRLHRAAAELAP